MSYKVHDKFIIEIAECIKGYGNNPEAPDPLNLPVLYRIKGFNALVFDKFGLDKLEKFEEEKYPPSELEKFRQEAFNAGMNEAWEIAKQITLDMGFIPYGEMSRSFGLSCVNKNADVLHYCTPQVAKEKIEAWLHEKEYEIKVGDVLETYDNSGVVLDLCSEEECHVLTDNGCVEIWHFADVVKTKDTFDIPSIISQLGGVK